MNQHNVDLHFLRLSLITALDLSKDPTTKVGAVIVSEDNRHFSTGYNGFPMGIIESPDKWERPIKYDYVIHAEPNAIMNAPFDSKGCTLYCTHQPCTSCLGLMINARVRRIVYGVPYANLKFPEIWKTFSEKFESVVQVDDPLREIITKAYSGEMQ